MGRLLVTSICSLDMHVNDADGSFEWAMPSDEVHRAVNELALGVGTQLCGRRTYELMTYWETADTEGDGVEAEFARTWQSLDKVVYSRTLEKVDHPRTRLVREFDADAVRALVTASPSDVEISGPTLAAAAWEAGLVEEVRLFVLPVLIGGGVSALPDRVSTRLDLLEQRAYADGTILVRYAVQR